MPRTNKKCKENIEPSTRPVLESLVICSSHQEIPRSKLDNEHTCHSSQCSTKVSEPSFPENFCKQTCSSVSCGKPLFPNQRSYQQSDDKNIECSESCIHSHNKSDENLQCNSCCANGVQVRTIKEALGELKEFQSQIAASSHGTLEKNQLAPQVPSKVRIPCFSDNTQKGHVNAKHEVPSYCKISNTQEVTTENELIGKQAETIYCPYKIPQCCPETSDVTKRNSSKDAKIAGRKNERHKLDCCENGIRTSVQPIGEQKNTSTTDTRQNKLKVCDNRNYPTCEDEKYCPLSTSLENQNKTSAVASDVVKYCPSPICDLPMNNSKLPEHRTSFEDKKSELPTNNVTTSNDKFRVKSCSGSCATTEEVKCGQKKCECHFPPAYNQFGCTGNIGGNCNCSNF